LNGNIDIKDIIYNAINNRYKKHLQDVHESIINSTKLEDFKPLNMPNPPRPLRPILPDSTNINNLGSFFDMFVKIEDLELIVRNINKYTKAYISRYQISNIKG
jgi:hypothetical protein